MKILEIDAHEKFREKLIHSCYTKLTVYVKISLSRTLYSIPLHSIYICFVWFGADSNAGRISFRYQCGKKRNDSFLPVHVQRGRSKGTLSGNLKEFMYWLHDGIIEYGFLSKHSVKMAGYWQFFFVCACLWTKRGQGP